MRQTSIAVFARDEVLDCARGIIAGWLSAGLIKLGMDDRAATCHTEVLLETVAQIIVDRVLMGQGWRVVATRWHLDRLEATIERKAEEEDEDAPLLPVAPR